MAMRTVQDRVRHALLFEAIGLALFVPLASYAFEFSPAHVGVVGIASATFATLWNFMFNLGFDKVMHRMVGHTSKSLSLRALHTILFEGGLMAFLIPPTAWYLGIGLLETLLMDLSIVVFYMTYAFGFNLSYDWLFPVRLGTTG